MFDPGTGRCILKNVEPTNVAALFNPTMAPPLPTKIRHTSKVRSYALLWFEDHALNRLQWEVTRLDNRKYTLQNFAHECFATSGHRIAPGTTVQDWKGRSHEQQWRIQETGVKGQSTFVVALAVRGDAVTSEFQYRHHRLSRILGWLTINLGRLGVFNTIIWL